MLDKPDNRQFLEALTTHADTVASDLSHAPTSRRFPIRGIPLLHSPLGLGGLRGVLLVGLGGRRRRVPSSTTTRLPPWLAPRGESLTSTELTDEERAAILRDRHPEWSEERIQRVVQSIHGEAAEDDEPGDR